MLASAVFRHVQIDCKSSLGSVVFVLRQVPTFKRKSSHRNPRLRCWRNFIMVAVLPGRCSSSEAHDPRHKTKHTNGGSSLRLLSSQAFSSQRSSQDTAE